MLKLPNKRLCWALALPIIVLNAWALLLISQYFGSLVGVVIIATLLSFLLDYPVSFLQRHKINRPRAVILVFLVVMFFLVTVGLILIPIILEQLNGLINRLPSWIDSSNKQLLDFEKWAIEQKIPVNLGNLTTQVIEKLSTQLQALSGQMLTVVVDTFSRILDVFLIIILTFYMLLQGDRLWQGIFQWLPAKIRPQIRNLLRQNFQNYFMSQAILASLMTVAMTVGLIASSVPFGLLFGLTIGIMTLFPFGAPISLSIVSLLLALQNFWLGVKVLILTTLIDQSIENFIAPRILSGITGLNPVWVILSLVVGLKIGGVLGLLLAVPLAGFVKGLLENWQKSTLLD